MVGCADDDAFNGRADRSHPRRERREDDQADVRNSEMFSRPRIELRAPRARGTARGAAERVHGVGRRCHESCPARVVEVDAGAKRKRRALRFAARGVPARKFEEGFVRS